MKRPDTIIAAVDLSCHALAGLGARNASDRRLTLFCLYNIKPKEEMSCRCPK